MKVTASLMFITKRRNFSGAHKSALIIQVAGDAGAQSLSPASATDSNYLVEGSVPKRRIKASVRNDERAALEFIANLRPLCSVTSIAPDTWHILILTRVQ